MERSQCLSVVMSCFNEADTVKVIAEQVLDSPYTRELIIVDDGSSDGTAENARGISDPRVRVLVQPLNLGKGAALRRGFAEVTSPFVIVQDADLEYDPSEYDIVLEPLLDGRADVVYGSRFHVARPHRVLYFWHAVGNRFLTTASNMMTNLNLSDMETCYKAFRREVVESFEIEEDRFGFEPEITAKVAASGWRVYEVGISYAGRTYAEGKKIGWKDGVRAMYCIVRYSPLWPHLRERRGLQKSAEEPAAFEEADAELAETLDSLVDASNYADWIASLMDGHIGGEILEVGAGHGTMTERLLAKGRVTANELSDRCLGVLRSRFADHPDVAVSDRPVAEAGESSFDSAVLVNVLEHVDDDLEFLQEVRDALRPGGKAAIFVPALPALYSDFDRRIGHHRRYRRSTLATVVARAGMEIDDLRYVNSTGAVAWWIMATKLGRVPTKRGPVRLYDRAVVPVTRRAEASRRPKFGQSLFCVARRPES